MQTVHNVDTDEFYEVPNHQLRSWLEDVVLMMQLQSSEIEDVYLRLCDIETKDEYALSFIRMRIFCHIMMASALAWIGVSLQKQGDTLENAWSTLERKQQTTRVLEKIMYDIVKRECYKL
ncbi:MAG TPA: hypothetical protein VHA78_00335 [Candidatus Peribacteraceae bacterium]|nr:hypothetical protein [Candidatus Peribacteraceae bacterium]